MPDGQRSEQRKGGRIRDRIDALDAARFVGRHDVIGPIEALIEAEDRGGVVLVHGPGGIGKSALLREIVRRARLHGRTVCALDGRLILTSLDAVREALAPAAEDSRPVVVIDSFELMTVLAPALRDEILPTLPAASVVVIAGRQAPDGMWFRDGWEHVARQIKLRPLSDDEATELLARRGLTGASATRTRRWALGSPLALQIGGANADDGTALSEHDLEETIVSRLLGRDMHDADPELVAVAAIARGVDQPLLAATMGQGSAPAAYEQLRSLPVVEPYGSRLTIHELVRAALRADLRRRDPVGYRQLVCRIADHLSQRVLSGEPALVADLAELIESDVVMWGVNGRFRTDRPGRDDAADVGAALGPAAEPWWPETRRFFDEAPECVTVARDIGGRLAGFTIATTPADAPPWADDDPVLGRWLAHARAHVPGGHAIVWRDSINLTGRTGGAPDPEVIAMLSLPPHLNQQLPVARAFYGVVDSTDTDLIAVSASVGATYVPELDVSHGGRTLQCHILDHGPSGLAGRLQGLVHLEQRIPLGSGMPDAASDAPVRQGLRDFHDPIALAASPLASGATPSERADQVRRLLRRSVDVAFGDSETDRLLRTIVERGYLDPSGGHRRAMAESHLSRTTYYRRLAEAVHRVAIAAGEQVNA